MENVSGLPPIVVDVTSKDAKGEEYRAVVRYSKKMFHPKNIERYIRELYSYSSDGLNDGGNMYGVKWTSNRKVIQIADPGVPLYKYTGSSATETKPFEQYPVIEEIRNKLYEWTGYYFNFCLYNSYTLDSKLGWHSDNEKNMIDCSPIGSVSFGFERRFRVRSTLGHEVLFDEELKSGSFLIMEEGCQKITEHTIWSLTDKQIEKIKKTTDEKDTIRYNLTFRMMEVLTE